MVEVQWPDPENAPLDRFTFYQVYAVTDGLITEIQGHDDESSALAAISNSSVSWRAIDLWEKLQLRVPVGDPHTAVR